MSHNTFGKLFRVTTFGESHGPGHRLRHRRLPTRPGNRAPAKSRRNWSAARPAAAGTPRSGAKRMMCRSCRVCSKGARTGTPIALLIENTDARSRDYDEIARQFRPGHADYTYWKKYGVRDYRGGRPLLGAGDHHAGRGGRRGPQVAELSNSGVEIQGWLAQLGPMRTDEVMEWDTIDDNPFFCPNPGKVPELEAYMDALRKSGDSVGARVNVIARGVPAGLGAPVYGKLDADLASAMMSINAAKGVEIGAGFASVAQKGTEHRDEMTREGFLSNHAGGILGGISSGQDLVVSTAFKPTSSLRIPCRGLDIDGNEVEVVTKGRHDPCVGIRATPIVEAMMALVLMDHVLRHRAQNG